jgi:hypothetical protein
MKAGQHSRSDRRGSAIFTVLIIVFALSTVLAAAATFGLQRAFMARRLGDRVRAKTLAEGGVAYAYRMLATNWSLRLNQSAFPLTPFGGGSYDVAVKPVGDYAAVITSTGIYAQATEVAALDVKFYPQSGSVQTNLHGAYDCVIFAKGTITWSGCGTFSRGGRIHGNNNFTLSGSGDLNAADHTSTTMIALSGNACWMRGNARAPVITDSKNHITGTKTVGAVPAITHPTLDLTPYYNHAVANGQVFTGPKTVNANTVVPGGVMWVNGALSISGNINLTGCFIATADIQIAGNGEHYSVNGYPAFVSRDSYIKMPGSKNVRGLMYTRVGDIEMSGGGSLQGQILCGNNFKKTGNSSIFGYTNCTPRTPGQPVSQGTLAAMAWQK